MKADTTKVVNSETIKVAAGQEGPAFQRRPCRRFRQEVPGVRVKLPYGRTGVETTLPDRQTTVVEPLHVPGVDDPLKLLCESLREPVHGKTLRDTVTHGQTVAVAVCGNAPAEPQLLMVQAVMAELADKVVPADVTVVVAGGRKDGRGLDAFAHRFSKMTPCPRVVYHDADDAEKLIWLGEHGRLVPVWLNRDWFESDIRITAGVVEPHAFAGFSGSPRLVAPGLVGAQTAISLHSPARVGHPAATWGNIRGNPVHEDMRAVVAAVGNVDFALDVLLNRDREIIVSFGGSLFHVHAEACRTAHELALCTVRGRYEVVVTSNMGYPGDRSLYECIPALVAAESVTKPGGTVVLVAECGDDIAGAGSSDILLGTKTADLSNRLQAHLTSDEGSAQALTKILSKVHVIVYSRHLDGGALAGIGVGHSSDVNSTISRLVMEAGPTARVCVLPEGGRTIPYRVG